MYPKTEDTVALLLEAARKSVISNAVNHPEDIANSMITAIEFSWPVVLEAHKRFSK